MCVFVLTDNLVNLVPYSLQSEETMRMLGQA